MNEKFITYNFQEIEEEVQIVFNKMKRGMSHDDFYKSMQHIYHHLNIAWNARNTDGQVVYDLDDPRMEEWKDYPKDIKLY